MKIFQLLINILMLSAVMLVTPTYASNNYPISAPYPDVVLVRKNCGSLINCGTTISEAQSWIANYKKPSPVSPILVEIGPGKFTDGFNCQNLSDVSLKGAGRDKTIISGNNSIPVNAFNCLNLHVQDLSLTGGFPAPVYWQGNGNSTWVNVLIKGALYGWTEECTSVTVRPVHKWFSSTIQAAGKVSYLAACSENWFYGSELIASGDGFTNGIRGIIARSEFDKDFPEIHVYGSVIRVIPSQDITFPTPTTMTNFGGEGEGIFAAIAGKNAAIHIHGTGIDVIGNNMPNDIAALLATSGGSIHADQAAFNLSTTPGGSVIRILNQGGHIHAPYQWQHIPPFPLVSVTGADLTTLTTGTSDGHPHPAIYDKEGCPSSNWYDTVDKVCIP